MAICLQFIPMDLAGQDTFLPISDVAESVHSTEAGISSLGSTRSASVDRSDRLYEEERLSAKSVTFDEGDEARLRMNQQALILQKLQSLTSALSAEQTVFSQQVRPGMPRFAVLGGKVCSECCASSLVCL